MCVGSTTCWPTSLPAGSSSAQLASCDSRMIVEYPVRNSEFCISRTMPETLAAITCSVIGSTETSEAPAPAMGHRPCGDTRSSAVPDPRPGAELARLGPDVGSGGVDDDVAVVVNDRLLLGIDDDGGVHSLDYRGAKQPVP